MPPNLNADQLRMHQIWQESCTRNLSWICTDRGVIRKGDILISDIEELKRMDASEIYPCQINAKRSIDQTKRRRIHIPIRRWYGKIVRKRLRIPRTHSKAGTSRKERVSEENFKASRKSLNRQNGKMTLTPWPFFFLVEPR